MSRAPVAPPRERDVLRLLRRGIRPSEVGRQLGLDCSWVSRIGRAHGIRFPKGPPRGTPSPQKGQPVKSYLVRDYIPPKGRPNRWRCGCGRLNTETPCACGHIPAWATEEGI